MSIILDLLIISFYGINSLCFLNVLNSKNAYLILFIGFTIDFIILRSAGIITLLLFSLYLLTYKIKCYFLKNSLCYFLTILILRIQFSFSGLIIYLIFIYLTSFHKIYW